MTIYNLQFTSIKKEKPFSRRGFTLIELLVVISIIGILAAIAIVSFTSAQKQARDASRKSDLKQYQTALEQYANTHNGFYASRTSAISAADTLCSDLGITSCPEDPRFVVDSSQQYKYTSNGTGVGSSDATKFTLWAKLENAGSTTYWVLCSSGIVGELASQPTAGGVCPL